MFEHLDDPYPFGPEPADVYGVRARGNRIRMRRRAAIVGGGALSLLTLFAVSSVAMPNDNNDALDVSVSETTVKSTPKTSAAPTTVMADETTTTTTPAVQPVTPPTAARPRGASPATPEPTTAPASHPVTDWSGVRVDWDGGITGIAVPSGGSVHVGYTVTNGGTWAVQLPAGNCNPDGLEPSGIRDGNFPATGPSVTWARCHASGTQRLDPGASLRYEEDVYGGRHLPNGQLFPVPRFPSATGYVWGAKPFSLDCGPYMCGDYHGAIRPYINVTSTMSSEPMPFTISLDSAAVSAASGGYSTINITYENKLGAEAQIYLSGDVCLNSIDATVRCDGTAGGTRIWVPANATAHLTANVYATTGYVAGAPSLPPGGYGLTVANQHVTLTVS